MIAAIIQARTGSTRLPNKIFKELGGQPLIWHVVNRLKPARRIDKIILATTDKPQDDILEEWALKNSLACFRGSEEDVLMRYYETARKFKVDVIVRITADDPFKDPDIIDQVIDLFHKENLDFAYNNNPPTFPEGLDAEVFSFRALEQAHRQAREPFDREHVTAYLFKNPALFKQKCLTYREDLSYLRWTIDTPQDLAMAEAVYNELSPRRAIFSMSDILALLERKPEIAGLNSQVKRSALYNKKD